MSALRMSAALTNLPLGHDAAKRGHRGASYSPHFLAASVVVQKRRRTQPVPLCACAGVLVHVRVC